MSKILKIVRINTDEIKYSLKKAYNKYGANKIGIKDADINKFLISISFEVNRDSIGEILNMDSKKLEKIIINKDASNVIFSISANS